MAAALTDTELSALAPAKCVDARGSACPGPLLEAKKGIGTVPVGEVLEIWSSDPVTKTDIDAWAQKVGHQALGFAPADGYDRVFVRRLK
jgi:tRNA 2-thiouridine synthesizing protein A